jgi:hypothetical protein
MKNLIDLGSQFIGFRDEATTLKGKTALLLMQLNTHARWLVAF